MRKPMRLRTRLLLTMLTPLLAASIGLGVAGYWLIQNVAERTSDRVLAGALGAIAETVAVEDGEVTLDLPPAAFGMLENGERDNVYYRIARGRTVLTGYGDLPSVKPASLARDAVAFRYAQYRGRGIRVAATVRELPRIAEPVVVEVAETLDNRASLRRRLLRGLLFVEAVLVLAATLFLVPALGWSLRPLSVLRRAVEKRSGNGSPDLSPLDSPPMPQELAPLAEAFDHLLGRLDAATSGIRRFTADASHQMRTPLSVLKVQLALARRGRPDDRDRAINEIDLAVSRLERLLVQLLALARAQEQGLDAPLETVDLREVASRAVERWIGQAVEADVDVRLEPLNGLFPVSGYRTLIFELISNLLDNAIRYNHRGGEVAIMLATTAHKTSFVIEDSGPGIPESDRTRALERFVRLDPDGNREGSGLGLSIVRSVAARIGASVKLLDRKGGGLRVEIDFDR